MCKPVATIDFLKKAEEKMEQSRKQEVEYELLKTHNEKLQEQHKQMVEENDTTISLNNELKDKLETLRKEMESDNPKFSEIESLKNTIAVNQKITDQLKAEIKKKDKLIAEYDEKFEMLEEQMQNAVGETRSSQTKASSLDSLIAKLQKEIDDLSKENEALLLSKEKEATAIAQERLDHKKNIGVLEKSITHLNREKTELEHKLATEKPKMDRGAKKAVSKETQTDPIKKSDESELKSKVGQREDEIGKLQKYASSLKGELGQTSDKAAAANLRLEEIHKAFADKEEECKALNESIKSLKAENTDLQKRREAAATEINKLTLQLVRRNSKPGRSETPDPHSKVGRHLSEAVILSWFLTGFIR